jgi:hypothetical protein
MMLSHTPKKWEVKNYGDNGFAVGTLAGSVICHILHAGTMVNEEGKANAHLVALAPTAPHECSDPKCPGDVNRRKLASHDRLLEACEALVAMFDSGIFQSGIFLDSDFRVSLEDSETVVSARRAITNAANDP